MGVHSNPRGYHLLHMLQQYESLLTSNSSVSEINTFQNKLLNVIATGVGSYTRPQIDALRTFTERNASQHPDDKVVQLAKQILLPYATEKGIPVKNVQTIIAASGDLSKLPRLTAYERDALVAFGLKSLGEEIRSNRPNLEKIHRFLKILMLLSPSPVIQRNRPDLTLHLFTLLKELPEGQSESIVNTAVILIKLYHLVETPHEVANFPAYHGEALNEGFKQMAEKKENEEVSADTFREFALSYSNSHLAPKQYLIRNSASVIHIDNEGGRHLTYTIDRKDLHGNFFSHRVTRVEPKEGPVYWREGSPPFEKGTEFQKFPTLQNLVETVLHVQGYVMPPPPRRSGQH